MDNCKVFLLIIWEFSDLIVSLRQQIPTDSATLPIEQRTRAELLLYIGLWNTRNSR